MLSASSLRAFGRSQAISDNRLVSGVQKTKGSMNKANQTAGKAPRTIPYSGMVGLGP